MNVERNIVLLLIVGVAGAAALIAFALVPQVQGVVGDAAALMAVDQQGSAAQFELIKKQRAETLAALEATFVRQESPVAFIEFLEKSSLGLDSFQIVPGQIQKVKEDAWPSLSLRVAAQGSYQEIRSFVERIETAPYLVEIVDFSLSQSQDRTISFSASLKTYLR